MEEYIFQLFRKYVKKGNFLLDVGCGDGSFMDKLAYNFNVSVIGVDSLMKVKPQCFKMDAENIDKLDKNFDIIYTKYSFHHFKDTEKFVKNAYKKLKDEGKLIIIDYKEGANTGVWESYFNPYKIKNLIVKWAKFKEIDFDIIKDTFFLVFEKLPLKQEDN